MRKHHNLIQGSAEWLSHRAQHLNASEAAAMLGISKHTTRSALLREKATGIGKDISYFQQRVFDNGHATEEAARPMAEKIIGDELFPAVISEDDYGSMPWSASFDGITLGGDVIWEHKQRNAELVAAMESNGIPDEYKPQLEHGLAVSGAERALFTVSDGTAEGALHAWYYPDAALRRKLVAGWQQFIVDLLVWKPTEEAATVEGTAPMPLPALVVQVEGRVLSTNLDVFRQSAMQVIESIKTDLQTDTDFADAEKAVKFCAEAEEKLDHAKAAALAQTASIDELFRTVDQIKEQLRSKRLTLDRMVKTRKEQIRAEIVSAAQGKLAAHVSGLNDMIGGRWIQASANFAEAIKGKKTISGLRDAADTELARAKIEASEKAQVIGTNRKALVMDGLDWMHLFPDFASVCTTAPEMFAALRDRRIQQHREAEERRKETERARMEAEERRRESERQMEREREAGRSAAAVPASPAQPQAEATPAAKGMGLDALVRQYVTAHVQPAQRKTVTNHLLGFAKFLRECGHIRL